ncbi:MAG: transposase [Deltaproteobacteria bacterium]
MNNRKKQRLPEFDYSAPGAYFVTICVQGMQCCLGNVTDGNMILNDSGVIVQNSWLDLPNHYSNCNLDEFVVMPNHVHGILNIADISSANVGNGFKPFPTQHGLPEIIRGFKTFSSRRINEINTELPFHWQKSYYDRVVRDEKELQLIREYIVNNPLRWELDKNDKDINGNKLFE